MPFLSVEYVQQQFSNQLYTTGLIYDLLVEKQVIPQNNNGQSLSIVQKSKWLIFIAVNTTCHFESDREKRVVNSNVDKQLCWTATFNTEMLVMKKNILNIE